MNRQLRTFFALAFAISWAVWMPVVMSGRGVDVAWARWLLYAGIAGPGLAAIVLLYSGGTRSERAEYWDRVFEFRRVGPRTLVLIVLGYPLLTALAVALDWLLSARAPDASVLARLVEEPATLLAYVGFTLLLGPIPEELGWRGYALDRLQSRWTPVRSSLLLGAAWAVWHLPEFWMPGTYQHGIGIGTPEFWLFVATAIGLSVLMTWVYNTTRRSTLSAIVIHGAVNLSRATVNVSLAAEVIRTSLVLTAAVIVVLAWRHGNARAPDRSPLP